MQKWLNFQTKKSIFYNHDNALHEGSHDSSITVDITKGQKLRDHVTISQPVLLIKSQQKYLTKQEERKKKVRRKERKKEPVVQTGSYIPED